MFGVGGDKKMRRRELRKQLAQGNPPVYQRWAVKLLDWPLFIAAGFAAISIGIALFGKPSLRWVPGATVDQPILAQVRFTLDDPTRREQRRQEARATTPSYYRINRQPIDRVIAELRDLYEAAKAAENYGAFESRAREAGWNVDLTSYNELRRLATDEGGQEFADRVERLRTAMTEEYTAEPQANEDRQPPSSVDFVRVVVEPTEVGQSETILDVKSLEQLIFINQRKILAGQASRLAEPFWYPLRRAVTDIVLAGLQSEPLLRFDKARTDEALQAAENAVPPMTVTFEPGQPLIAPKVGERLMLTEEHVRRLRLHEEAYQRFLKSSDPEAVELWNRHLLRNTGMAFVLAALSAFLIAYIRNVHPRLFGSPWRLATFGGLILITFLVVRAVDIRWAHKELLLAPAVVCGAIVTIAHGRRFALGSMSVAVIMMVLMVGGDLDLFVTAMLSLSVIALLLNEIRSRTRIITAGLLSAVAAASCTLAFGLIDRQEFSFALVRAAWAGATVTAAALFIQGVLPFIERAFGIATALTLLEWRDASKPLLQRLAQEAPGTYAHSLVLSTLSEAACESIGADSLLTSVGALYHDVGKIPKAEYFTENQEASINRHDKLSPTMSLLIIVGHVKDGVEMAKEYGLPRALHAFIEEHHGTTLVRYFHHVASEKQPRVASGRHDRSIPETEFRYPGPKPHTRETAILMLCDSVEGAVRSLPEPTAGRIESVVHQMVMDRLNDGQFDECDITLRELRTVEESLVKSLFRFYHGRVAYPKGTPKSEPGPLSTKSETAAQSSVG